MSQSLRILHCMRAPVGGLFRHVLDLAAGQAERGHQVGIVADSNSGDCLTAERFKALEPKLKLGIQRVPMGRLPGLGDAAALRSVLRIARELEPDVLHGHGAKGGAYARLAAQLIRRSGRGVKAFYTPHGGTLHYKPETPAGRIFAKAEAALGRMTDGFIFESAYARRLYTARLEIPENSARVIHNGLQPSDFADQSPNPDAADFVYVGELREIKGVDVLLRALATLNQTRPVSAVLVGSGPDAEKLREMAHVFGLDSQTRFPGALPAREAFKMGRCLAVPSRGESFPYIVLEAGAAAIPLISTDVGGIPEIVEGTDTPLIAPGEDTALASAMQGFLEAPEIYKARALRLKDNVAKKFSVANMTGAVLAFYREA